jgi:hypothetical protein
MPVGDGKLPQAFSSSKVTLKPANIDKIELIRNEFYHIQSI